MVQECITEPDLISWSLGPRNFVCDDIAGWEGGLEGWGGWTGLQSRSRRSMRVGRSCEGS